MKVSQIFLCLIYSLFLTSCDLCSKNEVSPARRPLSIAKDSCHINMDYTTLDSCGIVYIIQKDSIHDQIYRVTFTQNDGDTTITDPAEPYFWRTRLSANKKVSFTVTGESPSHTMFGWITVGYFSNNHVYNDSAFCK